METEEHRTLNFEEQAQSACGFHSIAVKGNGLDILL